MAHISKMCPKGSASKSPETLEMVLEPTVEVIDAAARMKLLRPPAGFVQVPSAVQRRLACRPASDSKRSGFLRCLAESRLLPKLAMASLTEPETTPLLQGAAAPSLAEHIRWTERPKKPR
jgi:hypothetical protein